MLRRAAREASPGMRVLVAPALADLVRFLPEEVTPCASTERPDGGFDVAFLDAEEVSKSGAISMVDPTAGAAAHDASHVVVVMSHAREDGTPAIVDHVHAASAGAIAKRIVTELAVLDVTDEGLRLRELAPRTTAREVLERTGTPLVAGPDLREVAVSD